MLDDFGLKPALEWLVRDVSRRANIPIDLTVDGDIDTLEDRYRTCIYRAVQEALTNCLRHSRATHIRISIVGRPTGLEVRVIDNGVGIDVARRRGLGLRGIEERVKELHGTMTVRSAPGAGTTLALSLPVVPAAEDHLARAAG
jgi:signal transduction histidine kinase